MAIKMKTQKKRKKIKIKGTNEPEIATVLALLSGHKPILSKENSSTGLHIHVISEEEVKKEPIFWPCCEPYITVMKMPSDGTYVIQFDPSKLNESQIDRIELGIKAYRQTQEVSHFQNVVNELYSSKL